MCHPSSGMYIVIGNDNWFSIETMKADLMLAFCAVREKWRGEIVGDEMTTIINSNKRPEARGPWRGTKEN